MSSDCSGHFRDFKAILGNLEISGFFLDILLFLGYFGNFGDFLVVLVILEFLRLFWFIKRFRGVCFRQFVIFGIVWWFRIKTHIKIKFSIKITICDFWDSLLWTICGFWDSLVIFEISGGLFWKFFDFWDSFVICDFWDSLVVWRFECSF